MLGKNLITAAAGAAGGEVLGVEDVFSTWLYTGTGSDLTITNGIDLAGEGGIVWTKCRNDTPWHNIALIEGTTRYIVYSNSTTAAAVADLTNPGSFSSDVDQYNSDGYRIKGGGSDTNSTFNSRTYASWTFRKAEKFFDVVTYTGTGSAQTIAHNLGSTPGVIIVKALNDTQNWAIYHRSLGATQGLVFTTAAAATSSVYWNDTAPTSTQFTVGSAWSASSKNYVAYLFAHDAGGFGDSGNDSVVSCGTFTGNTTVTLGWEPQWILIKPTSTTGNWDLHDNMRGWPVSGDARRLKANLSDAEDGTAQIFPNATGFSTAIGSATYIYIAIRRGPMKTPTDATKVFANLIYTGNATANTSRTTGILTDLIVSHQYNSGGINTGIYDRLRGAGKLLQLNLTDAEATQTSTSIGLSGFDKQNGYIAAQDQNQGTINFNGIGYVNWSFRRAPGYLDVVAYTGTGSARTVSHNLGVAPELMIVKRRNLTESWAVYSSSLPASDRLRLNFDGGAATISTYWNSTAPTSSVFTVGSDNATNASSSTYIAYLFASCPGVSKVGSYTGTGTTLSVNCGFTAGARFVLIKRTDSTGDWYVWDTARGIVSGNDPYLLLNSTAAEVTSTDYIDPLSSGFQISSSAPAAINANGGSFIFLAIA